MPKVKTLWEAAAKRDSNARYHLAERLARRLHDEALLGERSKSWMTEDLKARWREFQTDSHYRGLERVWNVAQFAAMTADVPGDTAECGVYTGLSSYEIMSALRDTPAHHHGFDSFEGLSAPLPLDGSHWTKGALSVSADVAERNLADFNGRFTLHQGWIPDTFAELGDVRFRFVHIDVDLYEPTRDSLRYFLPRMSPDGIVICDDYGFSTCPGAYRAVEEARSEAASRFCYLSSGQGVFFQ